MDGGDGGGAGGGYSCCSCSCLFTLLPATGMPDVLVTSCFLTMVTIVLMRVMLCDDGDDKNDVAQEMITPSCPWIVAIRMNTNILSSRCCGCFPWSNVAVIVVGVCITAAGNEDKMSV